MRPLQNSRPSPAPVLPTFEELLGDQATLEKKRRHLLLMTLPAAVIVMVLGASVIIGHIRKSLGTITQKNLLAAPQEFEEISDMFETQRVEAAKQFEEATLQAAESLTAEQEAAAQQAILQNLREKLNTTATTSADGASSTTTGTTP